ncbi:helix-turn-helix domain-containing protein [Desulfovibrio intestinalis]|uniref:Helix-turn-helix domain-containing protein n=1 Tax=Desulfovibrio intestinalis TaxID=58621 RepID=A0A7W8C2Z0_9BACT|nr:helix-turn-helix domain-containing protein [Desulfovibrio intestinalis]MBB5144637.1 hypothetical protein [Desulfovibrio intestinalis]
MDTTATDLQLALPHELANFWVNEKNAARILGLSVHTLRAMRSKGHSGPAYSKIGKSVRYSYTDLVDFMESRRILPPPRQQ